MRLKSRLLLAMALLLVPELLLLWFLASGYALDFGFSVVPGVDFLTFLLSNPVIIVINMVLAAAFLLACRTSKRK
jgi:hypothetical protein